MAESIEDILNSPVVQILSELIATGQISPQMAQSVLQYLFDNFGNEIFN